MAAYDSDSSEGEFTETNVLLGYASKDADEDTISRIGGRPEWLDPEHPPSSALARCKVCKDLMILLLQLNGELPERFPGHDRRLYVFACKRPTCRRKNGSVRTVRAVRRWKVEAPQDNKAQAEKKKKEEEPKQAAPAGPGLGDTLFGAKPFGGAGASGANPFSGNANPFSSGGAAGNPFSTSSPSSTPSSQAKPPANPEPETPRPAAPTLTQTFAEKLSLNTPPAAPPPVPEPWPETSAQPAPYPMLYLADAEFETIDPTPDKLPANARIVDAADESAEPSALDREAFESSMDATFQKFADRLSQNPDQVIRYEFAGTPLLYSKTDAAGQALLSKGGLPGCPNCGGRRTFEVQLTPHAIAELEADDLSLEGMEWGTIIVGVCEGDCLPRHVGVGEVGYLEEWTGVQWEELSKGI